MRLEGGWKAAAQVRRNKTLLQNLVWQEYAHLMLGAAHESSSRLVAIEQATTI